MRMSARRFRPLSVGPLRAFEAISRTLNFRLAAEELHLTQPAVSRQIKVLEDEVGARLLDRDTRRVRLTAAGLVVLQSLGPWLARIDRAVRQVRQAEGRHVVTVSTFASMATLWLIPRLHRLGLAGATDVRVLSNDQITASDQDATGRVDLILRYCRPDQAPPGAIRLFDEQLTPVMAAPSSTTGTVKPPRKPGELAQHTLVEDLDLLPSTEYRSWSHWLRQQDLADLQPRSWLYFNLAHQQVEAVTCGHGIALGRLPLVIDRLARGQLIEPFAHLRASRLEAPYAYWLIAPPESDDDERVAPVREGILREAEATREAIARLMARGTPGRKRR
jgi:LysR family glycine cleavage system transcriptional activator